MPYSAGTNVSIDGSGVISATGGGSSGPVYTPPLAAGFPLWINQGTSTVSDGPNGLVFQPELVGASSGTVLKGKFKALPAGDFDIMIVVDKGGVDWPFFAAGVSLLESSTGHYHSHHLGACFYADPAYSALSGDHSGMSELFWTDANTVSLGIGLPCPGSRFYCRITRVSGVITRFFKRGVTAPWTGLWRISIPSFSPDKIGITCLATCYGGYTNWPTQTFHVPHFGAVVYELRTVRRCPSDTDECRSRRGQAGKCGHWWQC